MFLAKAEEGKGSLALQKKRKRGASRPWFEKKKFGDKVKKAGRIGKHQGGMRLERG